MTAEGVDEVMEEKDEANSVRPLSKDAITFSGLPKSKWSTLDALDIIRERNKPLEPAKEPEKAPFFLNQLPVSGVDTPVL